MCYKIYVRKVGEFSMNYNFCVQLAVELWKKKRNLYRSVWKVFLLLLVSWIRYKSPRKLFCCILLSNCIVIG